MRQITIRLSILLSVGFPIAAVAYTFRAAVDDYIIHQVLKSNQLAEVCTCQAVAFSQAAAL